MDASQYVSEVVISLRTLGLTTGRDCRKALVKTAVFAPAVLSSRKAAAGAPLPPLPDLPESEAVLLTQADKRFARYEVAYNRRTILQPKLRALCKTQNAVAAMVRRVRLDHIPFAVPTGGHTLRNFY